MTIDLLTAFPELLSGPLSHSIVQRALLGNHAEIWLHDLRHYTSDRHGKLDDIPYGGGSGMIMMAQPVFACLDQVMTYRKPMTVPRRMFMSPQGRPLTQNLVDELSREEWLIVLCGHYKDVDARVFERDSWEEISIGDFVVSGGELPAALMVDAVIRRIPGVLGDQASADSDSFAGGDLDAPYYTKPEVIEGLRVPEVLLSGHHAKIAQWRTEQRRLRTTERRPDLLPPDKE
ncbi:MAG: tRNA (guanosine(37)-N1)-methyltransferase TrmD [Calditrichaeota bacterium]|nr:tRNA (guanosine(37)-N1)-methyltransferase TrmD [Calditrichota bacterium]MCB9366398.1 tRNA (guanosine(37)-N1)-methyltransferase TrmD [Calditrichota bacterium]